MIAGHDTTRENLTLTDAELAACQPVAGEGGHVLRALCPFHGSDHQRSLRVQLRSGRFVCFACGAWGYLAVAACKQYDAGLQTRAVLGSQ
jgi:CHC2 zinc finger